MITITQHRFRLCISRSFFNKRLLVFNKCPLRSFNSNIKAFSSIYTSSFSYKKKAHQLPESQAEVVQTDHLIIGGGVVGLAAAYKLAQAKNGANLLNRTDSIILIEKNSRVGEETSSRNSEVIHAGLYYPTNSNKERLCIAGRDQLYQHCQRFEIPHKQIGKWIVAQNTPQQIDYLHKLKKKGDDLGIPLKFLSHQYCKTTEPNVVAEGAVLESKLTGIIDSDSYIRSLEAEFTKDTDHHNLVLNATVTDICHSPFHKLGSTYLVYVQNATDSSKKQEEGYWIETRNIVNSAGLGADKLGNQLIGLLRQLHKGSASPDEVTREKFQYEFCKGNYFKYSGHQPIAQRLIYPVPDAHLTSLGLHLTLDMNHKTKFGPDVEFLSSESTVYPASLNYSVNPELTAKFHKAIQCYLKGVDSAKLTPDYAGIRPKLHSNSLGMIEGQIQDFVLRNENVIFGGLPGGVVLNLVGIESPGLTASLALGDWVASQIY